MAEKIIFIGYIEQPGIVDVQNLYQHASRKGAESIIVYKNTPTEKVLAMAKDKGHQMIQVDNYKEEAKKLETKYQADGYSVYLRDLTEIRDSMRDVGI
ncbi:MAG: hypothetical protein DSY91_07355 [Deltaproteobacteria bacterium]|nr:MAG: hypothetical protein DSY91_07355 [Deltaproteobacteria bacterium]